MRMRALLLYASLAGCTVGPNYRAPDTPPPAMLKLREADIVGVVPTALPPRWWRLFDDADLDRLVEKALAHNTDLRAAAANLQQARAALSEASAGRLPTSTASASYTRERVPVSGLNAAGAPISGDITTNFFSIGYDASYEIDLFGGVTRSIQAARADMEAAQAEVDAARVSVAAETARAYTDACSNAAQAEVARQTAALQVQTLDLTNRLLSAGRGTGRDVAEAQVLLAQAQAQVPALEAERRAALYALAVLTGDPPASLDAAAARCAAIPSARQAIPVGDGQALLARRPDVRGAERKLAADVARIGVATAQLYPSVTLLGSISLGAPRVSDLGSAKSLTYSAGPLISWNFPFNGAARARVHEREAGAQGSLAAFDGAVLKALQETEQALARLGGATEREASLVGAETASEKAADLSGKRFRGGSDNFLQLLVAERDRANTRAALVQAQGERADAQIALFKALGGGWEGAPRVETRPLPTTGQQQ